MTNRNDMARELEALRKRVSQLSAAILRINASLDVDTVLQEVVGSARALTGAPYGMIVTIDEHGEAQDFVSAGFTDEEHRQFEQWPEGPQLFKQVRDLPGVMKLSDLPTYVRTLGYPEELAWPKTFLGAPMRHRGMHVGNFFLGEKEGGQAFTEETEEVLVLFASQAATAIANARTHRDERQARADIEALVETSPVAVLVFDARTGRPVSLNREANRIADMLRTPGRSIEELLEMVTCRRADGREVSPSEFPLAQTFIDSETVRAEEIVLSVPDGRSVTTLLNVTPIRSTQGDVVSVVVTLQDLAPLEELDRLRTEFLGMVGHELRTPLSSIKGSAATALDSSTSLNTAEVHQFFRIIDEQADHMHGLISDLLDAGSIAAGKLSVMPVPTELAALVDQARNAFLSGGGSHTILIDLPLDLPQVLADRGRIVQVLNNLFANAARFSPGASPIRVAARCDGLYVALSVSDEGRGMAPEQLQRLFQKYSGLSGDEGRGTGLGLAICKGLVEAHGGRIRAASDGPGQGTQITFTIPVVEEADSVPGQPRPSHPGSERPPILVVDDDPQTLRFVRDALRQAGYSPLTTDNYRELSRLIREEKPHLVLLDLLLPGTDGIKLMQDVPEMADLPVIFISAYGRDETIARALEQGAVDYMVKPFSATELTARVRAALRIQTEKERFVLGDLTILYKQREVIVATRPVRLTAIEYELLRILSVNAGRVMTYDSLLRQLWSGPSSGGPSKVRTFVKQLRRKLGDDPAQPTYIQNVRAVGYRMAEPQSRLPA